MLFGSALNLVGEQASGVARLINEFSHIVFRIMGMIVRLAPLGVFGAVAFTTARYGVDSLSHLGALVLVFYATCLVFVMAVLGSVLRLRGAHAAVPALLPRRADDRDGHPPPPTRCCRR